MKEKGKIYIISGPSGVGKSTVLQEVFARRNNLFFSVSATTRAPRPGEVDGVQYFFLKREQFEEMLEQGAFLEHAQYVGNYYGTPLQPILDHVDQGHDVILDVEVQGFLQIKAKLPEAISIFVAPPSLDELGRRLRSRGTEAEERVLKRLERAAAELPYQSQYDHIVINDDVNQAADSIVAIMKCENN